MEWGVGKEGGKEEWIVEKETVISTLTPLPSSCFSFSNNENIKEENGRIIHHGNSGYESCVINKEFKNVCYCYCCYF